MTDRIDNIVETDGALILGAVSLFLVTSLVGRAWCAYACPQTVWTDLFMWIERLIEGDSVARRSLADAPMSWRKFRLRALKHGVYILISAGCTHLYRAYFGERNRP